jgi:TPR repeat protein
MPPLGTNPANLSWEPNFKERDRRRYMRHKVHTPAYASLNAGSGRGLDLNEILDISEAGMSIQVSSLLEVNRTLNLGLDLSETKGYINANGRVVWSGPSGRAGVRFAEMPDTSLRQLKEWLFVNSIVACANHAAMQLPSIGPQAAETVFEKVGVRDTIRHDEAQLEPPAPPDYTGVLTALVAVRREVEAIGPDLDAALQLVAERAQVFTRATGAAIAFSEGREMVCVATSGADAPGLDVRLQVGSGFSGECVRSGHLLRCDDSETDPRVDRESCRLLGIRSMIAVPVRLGDAVVGLLEVFSPKPNAFSANDNIVLQRLAETILAAINRAARASAAKASSSPPSAPAAADQPAAPTPVETAVPGRLPGSRTGRILLLAAAVTLATVLLWLSVPWIKSWLGGSNPVHSQPLSKPQVLVRKTPAATAADAGDFDGLRRLAEQGDPAAQFALGVHYATGEDVKQDYAEAVRWFSMAAEQGHVMAQATLGTYYWAGRGVPKDLSKAYFWTVLAQAGGDQTSKAYVSILTTGMSRSQILAAQQGADDWLKQHRSTGKNPADAP